ncbi:MAG: glycoside hydrolase superfamily [Benjaminiella poitrasii]|nr:MAG: glycoside hydrolase superfamily [Benjaminiella poitrasii]
MLFSNRKLLATSAIALFAATGVQSGLIDKYSVATYWGQNSKGGSDTQKALSYYCDDNADIIIMSFTLNFKDGSLPLLNLANSCDGPDFSGTELLDCSDIGKDIKTCQKKGKTVLMSLGGASGVYGFSDDSDAEAFADTLWNIYGAGNSSTRPFGDAIIDGFDLDIEGGGSTGYSALIKKLRKHFDTDDSKDYYITGAPQCPYPDAMLGEALDEAYFDAVNVQFYNNYCSATSSSFNFDTWDTWAKETSVNKDVKILMGIPGSSDAAGSGYVSFDDLKTVVQDVYSAYSSFGGVTIWDASASYANTDVSPSYQEAIADLVHNLEDSSSDITTSTKSTSTATKTTKSKTTKTTKAKTTKTTKAKTTKSKSKHHTKSSKSTITSTTTKHHAKTTSVSTRTSSTKTTTSSSPASTTTTVSCVSNGETCSTNGQFACSGDSFATCDHNKWVLRSCPNDLTCFSTTDGLSVYCAQGTSGDVCPSTSTSNLMLSSLSPGNHTADYTKSLEKVQKSSKKLVGPSVKPYENSRIIAEFSVTEVSNGNFKAIINARRLDQKSFGKTVTVQFKVASNIKITSVKNGKVTQNDNHVKIQYNKGDTQTMIAIIEIEGKVSSDVFVAPNVNSMKFS